MSLKLGGEIDTGGFLFAQGECGARAYQPADKPVGLSSGTGRPGGPMAKMMKEWSGRFKDSQHKLSSLLIVSLPVCEKPRARMKFLCFVSSLDWHIKQSGPAQIFKWRFKPLGSSLQECAFHIGWHSYQHVLAK